MNEKLKLIVGLGNPESKYLKTRHNVGHMIIDEINAEQTGTLDGFHADALTYMFDGNYNSYSIYDTSYIIVKTEINMNDSGIPVKAYSNYFKIEPNDILIIHDDIDLPFGAVKAKLGGSCGGHNGLRSIDAHNSPNYYRIRVGIGRPENKKDVLSYVLGDFTEEEREGLHEIFKKISKNVHMVLSGKIEEFNKLLRS